MSDDAMPDEKPDAKPDANADAKQEDAALDEGPRSVDEDWKAEVRREKEKIEAKLKERKERSEADGDARPMPPPDFLHFLSGLAAQALMQLGEVENPFEGKKTVDLALARYSIDVIAMLEEKTKGNLTDEEGAYIAAALHDLRMRYVAAAPRPQQG